MLVVCTYRDYAKRKILKTARRAGIKTKDVSTSGKRHKYNMSTATPPMMRRPLGGTLTSSDTLSGADTLPPYMFDDDLSGLSVTL